MIEVTDVQTHNGDAAWREAAARDDYEPPTVTALGDLATLTKFDFNANSDGTLAS